MQPIIFLDVDGVLVTPETIRKPKFPAVPGGRFPYHQFVPSCVEALNHLTDATGAVFVLSSTWRILNWPDFKQIAKDQGIRAPVIDRTPHLHKTRGHDIQTWLDNRETDRFIILDDDSDMDHLTPHLIKTTWTEGLTMELANLAITRLSTG